MDSTKLFVVDPTTGNKSVSLTLLVAGFVLVVAAGGLQVAGVVSSTGPFTELFYSASALYFGRRLNISGKSFSSEKAEDIKEKIEDESK